MGMSSDLIRKATRGGVTISRLMPAGEADGMHRRSKNRPTVWGGVEGALGGCAGTAQDGNEAGHHKV